MLALESHNAELLNLFELLPEGHMLISKGGKLGKGEGQNSLDAPDPLDSSFDRKSQLKVLLAN